jgi:CelD/BcsL family acetyltransferase involved in cellulose biosynthesis
LRLWILELDGRPAAAWHGFRVGSVTDYYQAGRDPTYERLSVGFVLLAHTIRAAIEEGVAEYRLGRGAEPFKYRLTDADPGLQSVALVRGIRGRAAWATARLARRTLLTARGLAHAVQGAGTPTVRRRPPR